MGVCLPIQAQKGESVSEGYSIPGGFGDSPMNEIEWQTVAENNR